VGAAGRPEDDLAGTRMTGTEASADPAARPDRAADEWRQAHTYQGVGITERRLVRHTSVLSGFMAMVRASPGAPCITELRGGEVGGSASYAQIWDRVRRRAAALRHAGLQRQTRVGLQPGNDIDAVVTILALLGLGAVAVLASPRDAAERVKRQLDRLGAVPYDDLARQVKAAERGFRRGDDSAPLLLKRNTHPDDLTIVVFTSGSTGEPRAVGQSSYNVSVNCAAVAAHHGLGQRSRVFSCLPLFHVNALEFTTFASMMSGSHVFMADSFDPTSYLAALSMSRAGIASVVPSILTTLTEARRIPDLPALRYFVSAAAPLASVTANRVLTRLKARIIQGYGLSEAANFSCTMPSTMDDETYHRIMIRADIPPIGIPLRGNEVAILRPDGAVAGPGETGEIGIRGHNVMIGYLGDEAATRAALRGGWLRTGDLGMQVSEPALAGNVFVVTGRAKHVIKVAGHTVGLEEVERALLSLPDVCAVAAAGIADGHFGEVLGVIVVSASPALTSAAIREHVHHRLGPDYVPRVVRFAASLPLLANGKIARQAVASELAAGPGP
jgi:long-chain acyl-CoA synthetase